MLDKCHKAHLSYIWVFLAVKIKNATIFLK